MQAWSRKVAAVVAAFALGAGPALAAAPVSIELNKLEPIPGSPPGCRAYMVAQNGDAEPLDQFRIDLVLFGTDGVIARRIALDLGPLGAGRTAVRLFDLAGLPCDGIGRMLVNDVLACKGGRPAADLNLDSCLDRVTVSSRASVQLVK